MVRFVMITLIKNKIVGSWLINIYKNQICGKIYDIITYIKSKFMVKYMTS